MVVAPPEVLYDLIPEEFHQVCLVWFLAENIMHDCVELDRFDADRDHIFGFFCVVNIEQNCFISLIVVMTEMMTTSYFLGREEFCAFLFLDSVNPMEILNPILALESFLNLLPESSKYLFDGSISF